MFEQNVLKLDPARTMFVPEVWILAVLEMPSAVEMSEPVSVIPEFPSAELLVHLVIVFVVPEPDTPPLPQPMDKLQTSANVDAFRSIKETAPVPVTSLRMTRLKAAGLSSATVYEFSEFD